MKKKKVRQIDGVRVLYHHCPAIFFTGLFCLVIAACSVASLFFPYFSVSYDGVEYAAKPLAMMNSLCFWEPTSNLIDGPNPLYTFVLNVLSTDTNNAALIAQWLLFAAALFIVLAAIMDILLLFTGLWFIFVGKSRHPKFAKKVAVSSTVFHILAALMALGLHLIFNFYATAVDAYLDLSGLYTYIFAGVSLVATIFINVIYASRFKNFIWSSELGELRRQLGHEEENHVQEPVLVKTVTKEVPEVKYVTAKGLPNKLSHIGGHEFAFNQNLEYAMIPHGIPSIGQGAFANCGNLTMVSIPVTVKKIGYNAFFNTPSLKRVSYAGTKEQWRHVHRGSNWLLKAGTNIVVCIDGPIVVNALH